MTSSVLRLWLMRPGRGISVCPTVKPLFPSLVHPYIPQSQQETQGDPNQGQRTALEFHLSPTTPKSSVNLNDATLSYPCLSTQHEVNIRGPQTKFSDWLSGFF